MKTKKTMLVAVLPVLACFAFLPGAQGQLSPPPDGCYSNFTTAEGCDALNSLTTGSGNTAVGAAALLLNATGTENAAVGTDALVFNDSGFFNDAFGAFALNSNV